MLEQLTTFVVVKKVVIAIYAFCETWYLPHSLVHNEQRVSIVIAR